MRLNNNVNHFKSKLKGLFIIFIKPARKILMMDQDLKEVPCKYLNRVKLPQIKKRIKTDPRLTVGIFL